MWWFNNDGAAKHQHAAQLLSLLNRAGEENKMKKQLVGSDKDREIPHQLQSKENRLSVWRTNAIHCLLLTAK